MDEAQQPDAAGTPGDGAPASGAAAQGGAGDGASNGRHEPLPPDDSASPEVADSAEASPRDPAEPAVPRPSTLESWMAAAAAAEKKKPVSTGERRWYILKVQSNREDSIRDALQKRIRIQGLDDFFGDIIVPIEKVTEFKNGKKRVVKRKLYPGYIVVNMELNDDTWFLVRETGGIGDFTGSGGKPSPMLDSEVKKIVKGSEEQPEQQEKIAIPFKKGDKTKITEGMFENYEGEVDAIDMSNGRVTVLIQIFGRPVPVELEHWQLEAL